MSQELGQRFLSMRRNHPAWLLLASRTGPLVLGSLKSLIDAFPGGIDFEDASEHLAASFAEFVDDSEFDFGDDLAITARKELRQWIRRGLIVERQGELLATDALQRAFYFLDSLQSQGMTSTASRLATVQRAIEALELQLSSSQSGRVASLEARIEALEAELESVQQGNFDVLDGQQAEEGIREVYQLAISLRADFRRVEDSYREADRTQELLKRGFLDESRKAELFRQTIVRQHEIGAALEPLDLVLRLDTHCGIAFLKVAESARQTGDDQSEWKHPLVRRQRLTLEQSLLVAILRQMFMMHEQESGVGHSPARVAVDELLPHFLTYFEDSGSDAKNESRLLSLLDQLKTHGIVSEVDKKHEITISPLIAHFANPESLHALLKSLQEMANDRKGELNDSSS